MRSIFFGDVAFEAVDVKLRVTDTSCTYARAIEMKDSRMIEDQWQTNEALRKEEMVKERESQ